MSRERRRVAWGLGVLVAAAVLISSAAWGAGVYLQQSDWQYQELDQLARAGLLVGHPSAPLSTWTDRLSRYEAAMLTLRAVEGVGQAYQAQGAKLQQLAKVNETEPIPTEVAQAEEVTLPSPTVRTEDLVRVEKLIQEFRTELVGMGERLDELQASLKLVLGMVRDIQKQVDDLAADQKKHKIDGYMQLRYRDDNATDGRREFQVRRVRVNLRGPIGPRTSYRVEAQFDQKESVKSVDFSKSKTSAGGPGSKAQLRTAYLDYLYPSNFRVRMGQAILPFGYELEESVPSLWSGERALWMDRLFPDQRDIGAFFNYRQTPSYEYRPNACTPIFDFAVVNGTGYNTVDNNSHSNVVGRIMANLPGGTVALSGYSGRDKEGASEVRQDRYGIGSQFALRSFLFQGEAVVGHDRGADVKGWYAQLGHPLLKSRPNLLFAKWDVYDEDRDAPDDTFRRLSLGYWYDLDKANRLTFVWESREAQPDFSELSKWDGNATYLQWQGKF
jgi:hypothetical protein